MLLSQKINTTVKNMSNETCPACGAELPVITCDGSSAAARIIARFNGVKSLSMATGIDQAAIYRWDYPKSKHGCDGRIPSHQHKKILAAAKARGINLRPEELVNT